MALVASYLFAMNAGRFEPAERTHPLNLFPECSLPTA